MAYYDEQLQQLQRQVARMGQLQAVKKELCARQEALSARVRELEIIKLEEESDVERLEGSSLASFFYYVIGKREEQLTKEREEAYAAKVKYDAVVRELETVERDLAGCLAELSSLCGCEQRYEAVLREKTAAVKAAGGAVGEEILRLEEHGAVLECRMRELEEAVSAGNRALDTANQVLSSLDSAEGWGKWDLFGGGLISDLAKHSHLDEAQGAVERLQCQLSRFKTELADVTIQADLQVNVDGFLRFADYFFDGLFADWAVLDRIGQAQGQVQDTKYQIENVLFRLASMMESVRREQEEIKQKMARLVREAKL